MLVGVTEAVRLGSGVKLGGSVCVGRGVVLSGGGWNGVGVELALGSTVTRLRSGEGAFGVDGVNVQDVSSIKPQSTLRARDVCNVILV